MTRHSEHQAQQQPGRFPERVQTERLVLRRWHEDDRAAVVDIWADPDVWRAIGPGAMGMRFDADYAAGRFEHHLSHWEQHGFGLWLARERFGGQAAGWVGAAHPTYVPELAEAVEIAWTLRRPEVTGAIVGVRSEEQVSGIAGAADIRLSDDDALAIEQRLAQQAA